MEKICIKDEVLCQAAQDPVFWGIFFGLVAVVVVSGLIGWGLFRLGKRLIRRVKS